MVAKTHLWPQETVETEGQISVRVVIEFPGEERQHLWYRVPVEYQAALTQGCDPFVLGTVFWTMRRSADLVVHGQVSPSLLRNLEEFQAAWVCWRPERYTKIEILADHEQEQQRIDQPERAISAFSGGVDSSFTAWRHRTGRCGRLRRDLQTGLMVYGLDIPLGQQDVFDRAVEKATKMLTSLDIALIPLTTNFRELRDDWEDVFATGIASCLMILQGHYSVGLIGSSEPYDNQVLPWGSNPITDGLLYSDTFQIIHDGAAFSRTDKIRELVNWSEALSYLRVCWRGEQKDRNCGRCEKCIRTILNFRAVGLGLPLCFEQDVRDSQIIHLSGLNEVQIVEFAQILSLAKIESISESWVQALEICLYKNRLMLHVRRNPILRRLARFGR